MALTDLLTCKAALNIVSSNTAVDAWLLNLIPAACAAINRYVKRELETATYTEYPRSGGLQVLPLRQRPVTTTTLTASTP